MREKLAGLASCLGAAMLLSFATVAYAATYESFNVGKLEGKLIVQWIEPDQFIFLPDPEKPLSFTRSNGDKIIPGRMLTDGGSIPRPIWILRSYSPWGYAPAFIVHDWLFAVKHCRLAGFEKYTNDDAAAVLAEVMKTMMETKKVDVDKLTLVSMHTAVDSFIAQKLWDEGKCKPPPAGLRGKKPIMEYELNFE